MPKYLSPTELGLPSRVVIEKLDDATLALVMDRKSRIIMADGKKIVEKAETIKKLKMGVEIVLKTSAPICSKTVKFLKDHKIDIV